MENSTKNKRKLCPENVRGRLVAQVKLYLLTFDKSVVGKRRVDFWSHNDEMTAKSIHEVIHHAKSTHRRTLPGRL